MRRSNLKSELSCKARVQAEALCPEIPKGLEAASFGDAQDRQKIQKSWKQSQGVVENKGSHTLQRAKTNPKRTRL